MSLALVAKYYAASLAPHSILEEIKLKTSVSQLGFMLYIQLRHEALFSLLSQVQPVSTFRFSEYWCLDIGVSNEAPPVPITAKQFAGKLEPDCEIAEVKRSPNPTPQANAPTQRPKQTPQQKFFSYAYTLVVAIVTITITSDNATTIINTVEQPVRYRMSLSDETRATRRT